MTATQERKTLARLSVAAGSAMTLAAAWLGVLRVEQPAALPDGAEASLALSQEAISATPPAPPALPSSTLMITAPTPGVASVTPTAQATSAPVTTAPAPASPAASAPAPGGAAATVAAPATATPVVAPATKATPVPTPRIVTRRSRAS